MSGTSTPSTTRRGRSRDAARQCRGGREPQRTHGVQQRRNTHAPSSSATSSDGGGCACATSRSASTLARISGERRRRRSPRPHAQAVADVCPQANRLGRAGREGRAGGCRPCADPRERARCCGGARARTTLERSVAAVCDPTRGLLELGSGQRCGAEAHSVRARVPHPAAPMPKRVSPPVPCARLRTALREPLAMPRGESQVATAAHHHVVVTRFRLSLHVAGVSAAFARAALRARDIAGVARARVVASRPCLSASPAARCACRAPRRAPRG